MSDVLPAPRFPDPRRAPSLRWGVLGPGGIAADFTAALQRHTGQRVVAVGSRSADRATAFAERFGIERAHGSYEALLADDEVDVVYVASPHTEHAAHALAAIAAGRHVLVEKPLAVTAAEGRRIAEAARSAGVLAMEAMWTRYLPQTDVVAQLLEQGAIGEPTLALADFAGGPATDPGSRLLDPALGGGALLDVGVYTAWWAWFALGRPERITATGVLAPSGIDLQAAVALVTPSGALAHLTTGIRGRTAWRATVAGTEGRIEITPPFWGPSGLTVLDAAGDERAAWTDPYGRPGRDGLCYQAAALARLVHDGRTDSPLHSLDDAVGVLEVLDEARRQLGYVEGWGPRA
ncbi:Gfo/Idh/MocA family oxidoreductase [Amnibacterium sp. CER49]|uniref:Gfo/Idh/MocA family protein n=1 Tax=Amnibacterium sp. CER49 TaxID=3039161 RepID=UPI0024478861|nr:Gfo/Idh/MocA family oxidoreductase [Amnibacterium sp. CER49]MDH2444242.1 Gfo/Idh/MocA family oxidoreductase [Amnibacterium sp. CER49]